MKNELNHLRLLQGHKNNFQRNNIGPYNNNYGQNYNKKYNSGNNNVGNNNGGNNFNPPNHNNGFQRQK